MKTITGIGFVMENMEELWFHPDEIHDIEWEAQPETVLRTGGSLVSITPLRYLYVELESFANHAYRSLGKMSEVTTFTRICENPCIGQVVLEFSDGGQDTYFPRADAVYTKNIGKDGLLSFGFDTEETGIMD